MANEIQTIGGNTRLTYSIAELNSLADAFVDCGFYGYKNKAEALVLMLKARADGIDPMTAADQYSIIQGRPALKSEAILIRFQAAGGKIKWVNRSDESCTLKLSHPAGGELEVTWNKERATKAGLWNKDNFKKHPTQMLAARCISEGVRALYPACLSGCYTPEEAVFFNDEQQPVTQNKPETQKDSAKEDKPRAEKTKASEKKASAVDAEVVSAPAPEPEPENVEESVAAPVLDENTQHFVDYMNTLRDSNPEVFDNGWAQFKDKFNDSFANVPVDARHSIYNAIKATISKAAANNINDYLGA